MTPRRKLEILPPLPSEHDPAALDAFNENRVRQDLAMFATAPGIFAQYVARARIRFQKASGPYWSIGSNSMRPGIDSLPPEPRWSVERANTCNWLVNTKPRKRKRPPTWPS